MPEDPHRQDADQFGSLGVLRHGSDGETCLGAGEEEPQRSEGQKCGRDQEEFLLSLRNAIRYAAERPDFCSGLALRGPSAGRSCN